MEEQILTGYPSVDMPWLRYYPEEAVHAKIPECTIYQNILNHNKEYPNDVALIFFGKKITYKQLFIEIDKTEKAYIAQGVKPGDNVALCVPATPEAMYSILALNKIGANCNMLNPTFTDQQLTDRINETEASVLFVVNELYGRVEKIIPKTCIKTVITCAAVNSLGPIVKFIKKAKNISNTLSWGKFITGGRYISPPVEPPYQHNTPAIMVYSSGTTGASKGIQLTNNSINATITQYEHAGFDFVRQDRYFAQIPIWFSTGISVTMLVPLCLGITVILEPVYNFEIFYKHISKYKPHFLITASGLVDYLRNNKEIDPAYKEFKYLSIGGEYVSPHAEKVFNEWLKKNGSIYKLHKGYGMCECGGTITYTNAVSNKIGSTGVPMAHVVVSAFDLETGKELSYGKRGELRVITPCQMSGYYKNPEATAEFFKTDSEGRVWACTGDMGYVEEDGNVYVDGRISDSYVNEKGNTIYLFDIEHAILSVEAVRQCKTVVSELDGKKVHVAHAVFFHGKESSENILKEIQEVCKLKLSEDYYPHLIKIHNDALPISPSGKLNIAEMRQDTDNLIFLE